MILKCTCKNPQQDAIYGPGMRVHTPTTKGKIIPVWRCTACATERAAYKPK